MIGVSLEDNSVSTAIGSSSPIGIPTAMSSDSADAPADLRKPWCVGEVVMNDGAAGLPRLPGKSHPAFEPHKRTDILKAFLIWPVEPSGQTQVRVVALGAARLRSHRPGRTSDGSSVII